MRVRENMLVLFLTLVGPVFGMTESLPTSPPPLEPGLVVYEVIPDGPAARAGVQVGDVLWSYDGIPLVFVSSLKDAKEKAQAAKKATVAVELRRGEETRTFTFKPGELGLATRPPLPPAAQALWEEGRALSPEDHAKIAEKWQASAQLAQQAGDARAAAFLWKQVGKAWNGAQSLDRAVAAYAQAALQSQSAGDGWGAAEALWQQGDGTFRQEDWSGAREAWERALAIYERLDSDSLEEARVLNDLGVGNAQQGDPSRAKEFFQRALEIWERRDPEGPNLANSLLNLGGLALQQSEIDEAKRYYQRALEIQKKLSPDSLEVAATLTRMGFAAADQGDLPGAKAYHLQALALREKRGRDSLEVSWSLNHLGEVARQQGNLAEAKDYHQRALTIRERQIPDSLEVARSLNNLGAVAAEQGDLAGAQEYFQRALAIKERKAPNSLLLATSLHNLGDLARQRGDLEAAQKNLQRALSIRERWAPSGLEVASTLHNLGVVAFDEGDMKGAKEYFLRALEIMNQTAPGGPAVVTTLENLGLVAQNQGELQKAQEYLQQALAIQERLAPDSLKIAWIRYSMGILALAQGDWVQAKGYFQQALAIQERRAPGSLDLANSLGSLGDVAWVQGEKQRSRDYYQRALQFAQQQGGRSETVRGASGLARTLRALGEPQTAQLYYTLALNTLEEWRGYMGEEVEAQASLWAQFTSCFLEYASLLLDQGYPDQAFHVSEKGKARALLGVLAWSQGTAGLSAEEIRQESDLERELAMAQHTLEHLQTQPDVSKETLQSQIAATVVARQALETFRQTLYEHHPDLQAQRGELRPLTEDQVGGIPLPPETLVLSFLVGEKETLVFALRRTGADAPVELTVRVLLGKAEELAAMVRDVRAAVTTRRPAESSLRRLSQALLAPLSDLLQPGQPLILCPDGILWDVPWAALPLPTSAEPLVTDHAISLAPSVTVLDWLLRRPRRKQEAPRLLAVGNPRLEWAKKEEAEKPVQVAMAPAGLDFLARVRDGDESERGQLLPLPQAEAEAQHLGQLYAPQAKVLVGEAATEEAVKAGLGEATVLHFATHGVIDDGIPMQSGLLLNRGTSGEEDGRLTAREIMRLNLKAEVAVLSACQTARGRRENGEGILGLSWAFVAAGVPQVMVSQWKVADDSTAVLMEKFHEGLRAGLGVAEALRQAQLAVRAEERWASPYHWAAFVEVGTGR